MGDSHEVPENPPCWCGERDPHRDESVYEQTCGGLGTLECRCGGDLCVCHNHGEVQCEGCDDCQDEPTDDGYGDMDDEEYSTSPTEPDYVVGEE